MCLQQSRELKLNTTFAFDTSFRGNSCPWNMTCKVMIDHCESLSWQCLSKIISVIHISCGFSMRVFVVPFSRFSWRLLAPKFSKYNLIILGITFRFDWMNWGFSITWYLKWAFILKSIACQQSLNNLKCVKRRNKGVKKVYEINYWSILFICLARAYLKHSRTFRTRTFFIRCLFQKHCDRGCCAFDKTR